MSYKICNQTEERIVLQDVGGIIDFLFSAVIEPTLVGYAFLLLGNCTTTLWLYGVGMYYRCYVRLRLRQ